MSELRTSPAPRHRAGGVPRAGILEWAADEGGRSWSRRTGALAAFVVVGVAPTALGVSEVPTVVVLGLAVVAALLGSRVVDLLPRPRPVPTGGGAE